MVSYTGKLVLAPMVRAGELPTRLLALKHGADLVWSPEIIDKKILTCDRKINSKLGTIDYLSKGQTKIPGVTNLVFRTCPLLEDSKLIFQMGTASPDIAVEAAKIIINDVSGIDINAGCPKHFSIHAGMGAALLKTPDLLVSILTNLVEKVGKPNNKPVSVKIRLLPEEKDTLELVRRLLGTGISNLTVHCRTQPMRNREDPIRNYIDKIKQLCDEHKVSLIINGAIIDRTDFEKLQEAWGKDVGGMIATTAEANPSCFNKNPLTWVPLIREYIEIAQKYDNFVGNTKYMLTRMIPGRSFFYQVTARSKTYDDFFKNFDLINEDGTKKEQEQSNKNSKEIKEPVHKINESNEKKHKLNEVEDTISEKKPHIEEAVKA